MRISQSIFLNKASWELSILQLLFIIALSFFATSFVKAEHAGDTKIEAGISEYKNTGQDHTVLKRESKSTTDHSQLEELQGPFTSGPEVTKACLKCHNTAGHQFKKNKHWTWE